MNLSMKSPLARLVGQSLAITTSLWVATATADETALLTQNTTAADDSKPLVINIGLNDIYCRKTACDCIAEIATREYTGLVEALQQKHHITLQITYYMEVFDLEKAILAGKHQGVLCKPWTALRLAKQAGANLKRVADLRDPDGASCMTGIFLTKKSSPITSLNDLNGKRIAFGQPDAYEKNQCPLQMLAAATVKPGPCLYQSSCGENLDALMSGKVDVAVVSSYALTASCAVDFAKPEDFKTIAKTEQMPLTSLMLDLNKVSPADAMRLQMALLDLADSKVPNDLLSKGFVSPVSWKPNPCQTETPKKP